MPAPPALGTLRPTLRPARRRTEARTPHRTECRAEVTDCDTGRQLVLRGRTVNISATGLAVQLGCAVSIGSPMDLILRSADGLPIRLRGTAAHCRRVTTGTFEVGVQLCTSRAPGPEPQSAPCPD